MAFKNILKASLKLENLIEKIHQQKTKILITGNFFNLLNSSNFLLNCLKGDDKHKKKNI